MDNEEMVAARAKLAQRMGETTRTGGKGSVRRKNKVVHKTQITDDNKLKSISKKFGCQPLQGIEEVNMFKDDNTIVHFQRPEVLSAIQSNAFIVMGKAETKSRIPYNSSRQGAFARYPHPIGPQAAPDVEGLHW